jgi:hypothetical protein
MKRTWIPLVVAALGVLPFSSCTCHRDTPEPPTRLVQRTPGGFGAMGTPRKPLVPPEGEITPREVEPAAAPTLPATTPEAVRLPDDFPADVPVFEGSEVMAVQQLANNARSVIFNVQAEAPQVFTFYKDSMQGKGWDVAQEYQAKEQSFLSFKKGKTITNMSVTKDPKSGKRIIAIMYYEEEDLPFPEF